MNHVGLIIKREYLTRVRRKSFIISTILLPVLMIGLMALPSIVAVLAGPEEKSVAVVDNSGVLDKAFVSSNGMKFEIATDVPLADLKAREDLDAILVIPENVVDEPTGLTLYTNGSPSPQSEMFIAQILNNAIEQIKLESYNIENLEQIIAEVRTNVSMKTIRIDGGEEQATSSIASYFIGLIMAFILYMFIMLYGQMVMNSIIEEKNNRVLEIVVSSVKPTHLMLGKILGIGAVAVTQLLIWGALIGGFTAFVMPSLISNAVSATGDVDLLNVLSTLGDPTYILSMFGLMGLFLIFGYVFYSAINAAIGSAVDNIQDASQLQAIAVVPIIIGLVFSMTALNDPNSTLAIWLSMIPFTSPMVMMARIPFGVSPIQIIASLAILLVSMYAMIWFSAKVYRVGIFMYGKKPTLKELIRWARYK